MLTFEITPQVPAQFIKTNIPLADKTWFKTGGLACYYCEPTNNIEFCQALSFARTHNFAVFVLGHGANCLISDTGFDGLVIRPALTQITLEFLENTTTSSDTVFVKAEAGVSFAELIHWCLDHNISGLEEFSGIPGTVGGSVFINIHYYEYLLSDFLIQAQVLCKATGNILTVDKHWFNFGYNYSTLHTQEYYLLNAVFQLKQVSATQAAYARGRSYEIIRHRHKRYPAYNTCGSFFRNFYEHEVTLTSAGKKLIYVAYYLERLGVKGELSHGGALVSHQHANMLINTGNATSNDIVTLARTMQELVYTKFKILPQPECQLIGFKEYPLLK
jgi:UDP-N-acetylmuramate dehydrogenase